MKNRFGIFIFVCCFILVGGLPIMDDTYAFTNGDEVVLQNTFHGRHVRSETRIANETLLGTIVDGTRGTFLQGPVKTNDNIFTWYKVRWDTPFAQLEGWTADSNDDCAYIASAEEADKRDSIAAKLFKINLNSVDGNTNHDYYGYGCEPPDDLDFLGLSRHAGLDVQTKVRFDPNRDGRFYSLTSGEVIRADPGDWNTVSVIAVYNATEDATVLYLHASSVYVEAGDEVEIGDRLGRQGNTGLFENNDIDRSHVHIEVRDGETDQTSAGIEHVNEHLYLDPVEYLFEWSDKEQPEVDLPENDQTEVDDKIFTIIANEDVNADGWVNIIDLLIVLSHRGEDVKDFPDYDVNADGTIDNQDVIEVINGFDVGAAPTKTGDSFLPHTTALLRNYPNPFNPETWIPYQLARPSDVQIAIYDAKGMLVRRLALGHQPAGSYTRRGYAAYWDGHNEFGEPVASGIYFYTLTAGEFTATRKMLIRK